MAMAMPISQSKTSPKVFALISASTHSAGRAAARFGFQCCHFSRSVLERFARA
jgi:hypothetical protein